jgi:hypothetical protein
MADDEKHEAPEQQPEQQPEKQPWGPGMLLLIGIILVAVAAWCGYDLVKQGAERAQDDDTSWLIFNWGGAIAGGLGAIYCFVMAAIRSKKGGPGAE